MFHARLLGCLALAAALFLGAGCASSKQSDSSPGETDARTASSPSGSEPALAPSADEVRSIQLYSGSERSLPILPMTSDQPLTLEFDLMAQSGRPLSIYFEHADRQWRRDLSPSRYMESFVDDQLVDYRASRGTDLPYVHYTYRFPNDDIRFRISGNYIVRVTEQGRPDEVLFERAFFLTEDAGSLTIEGENVVVTGQQQPSFRPIARFTPPNALRGNPFGYAVCFVRNGRLDASRCSTRPRLAQQPELAFEVDRRDAFAPRALNYAVDLSNLDGGGPIERVDRSATPFRVLLEPDFARFADDPFTPPLNGQIVVKDASRGRLDPQLTAEYVRTTFALVPPNEQPVNGEVRLFGSFTGMRPDPDLRLSWVADRGRYEGEVLLKQGLYEYQYQSTDAALEKELRQTASLSSDVYTTFVYYDDPSENTDRLLTVQQFR
jgi:hypothetical protein